MMKKNLIKKDPITSMIENSLMNLPTPSSISYLWNMGFLLGMTLTLQIVTGLILSMNYVPSVFMAFDSVIHILRDIEYGWIIRYAHMNGASLFFIFMYIHIARGIYYNSPSKLPMVWNSGVIILLMSMMAAFMGYVLPWGQMSFWGATVITSMISAIPYLGPSVTTWVWGNFSVSQPTLNRFFSLHFIIPLVIAALVLCHLIFLHQTGSSNPCGLNPNMDKMKFFPYFLVKDTTPLILVSILTIMLISFDPNTLGDVENFNQASSTTTPTHIQPEWYFLFAYAILRAIPSKIGGVAAMGASILILMILSIFPQKTNKKFNPLKKMSYWSFITTVILLTWIGANPVEPPYISIGQLLTISYFSLIFLVYSFSLMQEHNIFNVKVKKSFSQLIILSSILGISSSSWVMLWTFMEINTISMSSLIAQEMKKSNSNSSPALLYLVTQLMASIIFFLLTNSSKANPHIDLILTCCLLMKMGVWPLHIWYLLVLQDTKMKTTSMKLIMTWQKILPVYILSFFFNNKIFLVMISCVNMLISFNKLKKLTSIKSTLILSSMNNNSWFILAMLCSLSYFLLYFFIYSASLLITLNYFNYLKNKSSTMINNSWETMIILGNLSSIPPSGMFMGKIMILMALLSSMISKEIIFLMLLINCIFVFHYFWSSYSSFFSLSKKNQIQKTRENSHSSKIIIFLSLLMMLTIILGLPNGFILME